MSTQISTPPVQEFDVSFGLVHRLKAADGRVTEWADYRAWTYLEGYVGYTAHWSDKEGVMKAEDFAREFAVK